MESDLIAVHPDYLKFPIHDLATMYGWAWIEEQERRGDAVTEFYKKQSMEQEND